MESSTQDQTGRTAPIYTGRQTLEVMLPHRIFLRHARNLDTVSPLHAPLLPHGHTTLCYMKPPPLPPTPPATKNVFPFVSRIAECCWLLFTQKFAEAVSCPPTSAPWSEEGEERRGDHVRVVHSTYVLCMFWVKTHALTHVRKLLFKSVLCILLNALLAAPRKQNTHLCNFTQSKQEQAHTKTGARHFNFLHAQSVW